MMMRSRGSRDHCSEASLADATGATSISLKPNQWVQYFPMSGSSHSSKTFAFVTFYSQARQRRSTAKPDKDVCQHRNWFRNPSLGRRLNVRMITMCPIPYVRQFFRYSVKYHNES